MIKTFTGVLACSVAFVSVTRPFRKTRLEHRFRSAFGASDVAPDVTTGSPFIVASARKFSEYVAREMLLLLFIHSVSVSSMSARRKEKERRKRGSRGKEFHSPSGIWLQRSTLKSAKQIDRARCTVHQPRARCVSRGIGSRRD